MKFKISKSIRNFLILIVIAFFIKTSILEIYVVPTGSMLDTIEVNDAIVGNKFIYGLRTPNWIGIPFTRNGVYIPSFRFPAFKQIDNGDISIFEFPNDDYVKYVKRCIGLPGQYVQLQNGEIFLGESLDKLEYRKDLTYPPNSRFTKERKASFDIMGDSTFTEKDIASFRLEDIFPYYSPIEDNVSEIINLDNMQLQVPYKDMEIDLNDEDYKKSFKILFNELKSHNNKLVKKPSLILLTKSDTIDVNQLDIDESINELIMLPISSINKDGIKKAISLIADLIK